MDLRRRMEDSGGGAWAEENECKRPDLGGQEGGEEVGGHAGLWSDFTGQQGCGGVGGYAGPVVGFGWTGGW